MTAQEKRQIKKPRERRITLDFGRAVPVNGLYVDKRSGRAAFLRNGRPVHAEKAVVESGYYRSKGFKPLVRAKISPTKLYGQPNRALERYELILAVDTNTKTIECNTIAVTSVVVAQQTKVLVPGKTVLYCRAEQCFEFRNPIEKPELIGWKTVIEMLQANPVYRSTMKIGIIVDSDLDNLDSYNNRVLPISDGFYLPQNFTLIYASSDNATESVANRLLKVAHATASRVLRQICERGDEENLSVVENRRYSHFRIWNAPT